MRERTESTALPALTSLAAEAGVVDDQAVGRGHRSQGACDDGLEVVASVVGGDDDEDSR